MRKILIRLLFIVFPALLIGGVVAFVFNPLVACFVAVGYIGLGLDCTEVKPERGEK